MVAIIVTITHPPSFNLIRCHAISSFATEYRTFTAFVTFTSLAGKYIVFNRVFISANKFPKLSMLSWLERSYCLQYLAN